MSGRSRRTKKFNNGNNNKPNGSKHRSPMLKLSDDQFNKLVITVFSLVSPQTKSNKLPDSVEFNKMLKSPKNTTKMIKKLIKTAPVITTNQKRSLFNNCKAMLYESNSQRGGSLEARLQLGLRDSGVLAQFDQDMTQANRVGRVVLMAAAVYGVLKLMVIAHSVGII